MAEKAAPKNPRRADVLTRDVNSSSTPVTRPINSPLMLEAIPRKPQYVQNEMLDKFMSFLLGPNDPRIMKQEVPFVGPALESGGKVIGKILSNEGAKDVTEEMLQNFMRDRSANVARETAERYAKKVVRPNDFPIGEIEHVNPHLIKVHPPAGMIPRTLDEMWELVRSMNPLRGQ